MKREKIQWWYILIPIALLPLALLHAIGWIGIILVIGAVYLIPGILGLPFILFEKFATKELTPKEIEIKRNRTFQNYGYPLLGSWKFDLLEKSLGISSYKWPTTFICDIAYSKSEGLRVIIPDDIKIIIGETNKLPYFSELANNDPIITIDKAVFGRSEYGIFGQYDVYTIRYRRSEDYLEFTITKSMASANSNYSNISVGTYKGIRNQGNTTNR